MEALDSARDIATAAGDEILASNVNDIAKKVEKLAQLRKESVLHPHLFFIFISSSSSSLLLFNRGKGNSPEAKRLQTEIAQSLDRLSNDVDRALDQLNSVGQSYDVITKEMPIAKVGWFWSRLVDQNGVFRSGLRTQTRSRALTPGQKGLVRWLKPRAV